MLTFTAGLLVIPVHPSTDAAPERRAGARRDARGRPRCPSGASIIPQSFARDVDADLVPIFETLRDGSGWTRHLQLDASEGVRVDAVHWLEVRHANDAHGRHIDTRSAGAAVDGDPDLAGILRAEFMEAQGRQQAEDPFRNPCGDFDEGLMVGRLLVGRRIETASHAGEPAGVDETSNLFRMDAGLHRLGQAKGAAPAREPGHACLCLSLHMCKYTTINA